MDITFNGLYYSGLLIFSQAAYVDLLIMNKIWMCDVFTQIKAF